MSQKFIGKVNKGYRSLEKWGLIKKTPNYVYDYLKQYPKLKILEDNYELIKKECEAILAYNEEITDLKNLMGRTQGGIHEIKWKSFMLKGGVYVKENCEQCPETTALLKKIPGVRTAFFSILSANQYISPHWGYYNGFMRYHLGLIIPNNNENNECWIRIAKDKIPRDELAEKGDKYYWKNGEGIVFNDNYTHEASNESDQVRVVLFLDLERKMPFIFSMINKLMLNIANNTSMVKKMAKNAVVKPAPKAA